MADQAIDKPRFNRPFFVGEADEDGIEMTVQEASSTLLEGGQRSLDDKNDSLKPPKVADAADAANDSGPSN